MTIGPKLNLDSNNIPETLPESHSWDDVVTADVRPESRPGSSGIPVIDLAGSNAVSEVRRACERWGSFQVINHGVSAELLEKLEVQMGELFGLPAERKLRAAKASPGSLGYGMIEVAENFSKLPWSEGFLMKGSPAEHARLLWPHSDEAQQFTDVMVTCQNEVNQVSERIMSMIIKSLDIAEEDTKWANPKAHGIINPMFVQLNSYPICPDPTRAIGVVPHTDSSMITLLYQSNGANGLQIHVKEEEGNRWVTVPPIEGALVVFVADLMQILSNGQFKSALHRSVPSAARHRFSAVFFYVPPDDVEVSPLTQLTTADYPPLYHSVMVSAWRSFKKKHMYNVFETIKIKP